MKNNALKKTVIAGVVVCAANGAHAVTSSETLEPFSGELVQERELTEADVTELYATDTGGPIRKKNTRHEKKVNSIGDWFEEFIRGPSKKES